MEERSKAERIAYLRAYATEMRKKHTDPWMQETVETVCEAIEEQVNRILEDD